jgi:hypothetical protein
LLNQAGRFPSDKIEPMSDTYNTLRVESDGHAETGQPMKAVEAYQQLSRKLMAWNPTCRTISAMRRVSRT